jgi:anti-sigma B factor antagonist
VPRLQNPHRAWPEQAAPEVTPQDGRWRVRLPLLRDPDAASGAALTVTERPSAGDDGQVGGEWSIALDGELDLVSSAAVAVRLHRTIEAHPVVRCDLSELTFLDAAGVGLLVSLEHAARDHGGHLRVQRAHGLPAKVLRLTGVDQLLMSDTPAWGGPDIQIAAGCDTRAAGARPCGHSSSSRPRRRTSSRTSVR